MAQNRRNYARSYCDKGFDLYLGGKWDEAITQCNEAIEQDSDFYVGYYYRAKAYEKRGDFISAAQDYEKAAWFKKPFFSEHKTC